MRRRYVAIPRITHYELVIGDGMRTEEKRQHDGRRTFRAVRVD